MKKNKLLTAIACFALLITGCNGGKTSSKDSSAPSSKSGTSAQSTNSQQSSAPSDSSAPAEDDYYYSLPFPSGSKGSDNKWKKGYESTWTFNVTKNHAKMAFAISAQMTSSSHGDRSLFTNHTNASSTDSFESNEANDGTPRIVLKVNDVGQTLTTKTYEEAGLTNSEYSYFRIAEISNVTAGQVNISMTTNAQAGYRLYFGEDVRLFYPKADGQDPAPTMHTVSFNANGGTGTMANVSAVEGNYVLPANAFTAPEGKFFAGWKTAANEGDLLAAGEEYNLSADVTLYAQWAEAYTVTFAANHCKVLVYPEGEDYTKKPVEATSAHTTDDAGNFCKYAAAVVDDPATTDVNEAKAEVKPQVNFKVQCDEGYEVDGNCFVLSGTEGTEWNNLKDMENGNYRITTIKADISVTINAVATGTLKAGYVATFVTEHCSVKVYTAKNFSTEDTATPYMSRSKTVDEGGVYQYAKGESAQLSFEVIPDENYEFVPGFKVGEEPESDDVEFIAPSAYNKVKRSAENRYNLTKVSRDLTITIVCTEKAPEAPVDGTKVKKTAAELKAENGWEDQGTITDPVTIGQVDGAFVGSNGVKYYDNGENIRIYVIKNDGTADGTGSVSFTAKDGYIIKSVKITFVWNKNVGQFPLESDEVADVNKTAVTYNITNPSTANAEQLRISAIEVVYDAVA